MERNRISTSGIIAKRFDDLGRVTALRRMYMASHYIRRATSGGACSTDTLLLPPRTKSAGVFGYCISTSSPPLALRRGLFSPGLALQVQQPQFHEGRSDFVTALVINLDLLYVVSTCFARTKQGRSFSDQSASERRCPCPHSLFILCCWHDGKILAYTLSDPLLVILVENQIAEF